MDTLKTTSRTKLDTERLKYQERLDKLKLELTENWLLVGELRREAKNWRERYEVLREGME